MPVAHVEPGQRSQSVKTPPLGNRFPKPFPKTGSRPPTHKRVEKFLDQVMLPDVVSLTLPVVPSEILSNRNVAPLKVTTVHTVDVAQVYREVSDVQHTVPVLLQSDGTPAAVWTTGVGSTTQGLPIVQVQDLAFPMAMPMLSQPIVGSDNGPRAYRYPLPGESFFLSTLHEGDTGSTRTRYESVFTDYGISNGLSRFPIGFARRPIFSNRLIADPRNYFWVDSGNLPAQLAIIGCQGIAEVQGAGGEATALTFRVIFSVERLGSDGSIDGEETITQRVVPNPGPNGTATIDFNAYLNVDQSGFYRTSVAYELEFDNPWGGNISVRVHDINVNVAEYTQIGTAFVENTQYTGTVDRLSSKIWPIGVSTLFSFRGLPLLNAGSINAVNLSDSDRPMFYQATSLGYSAASALVPASRAYNEGSGGAITKGLWSYAQPASWFSAMIPTVDSHLATAQQAPCLSYWPATNQSPGAMNYIMISPQGSTETTPLIMRWTTTTTAIMALKTQVITPCDLSPLSPDEMAAARLFLSLCPNFSENDWHGIFSTIAHGASGFVTALKSGTKTLTQAFPVVLGMMGHLQGVSGAVEMLASMMV